MPVLYFYNQLHHLADHMLRCHVSPCAQPVECSLRLGISCPILTGPPDCLEHRYRLPPQSVQLCGSFVPLYFLRINWTASLANLVALSGGFHGIHSDFCVAPRMLIGFNFTVCPPSTSTMYRPPASCPVRTRPLRPLSPSIRKPHRMISLPGHPSS